MADGSIVAIAAQCAPSSELEKICCVYPAPPSAPAVGPNVEVMASTVWGASRRTTRSFTSCPLSPAPADVQPQPVSDETSSPSDRPAMSALLPVSASVGSSFVVGPRPSASSQSQPQLAP